MINSSILNDINTVLLYLSIVTVNISDSQILSFKSMNI